MKDDTESTFVRMRRKKTAVRLRPNREIRFSKDADATAKYFYVWDCAEEEKKNRDQINLKSEHAPPYIRDELPFSTSEQNEPDGIVEND